MHSPNLLQLSRIEERLLKARLEAVRLSISHAGEKGRELEFQVRRVLRDLLPPEYGLTTGFVAWLSPTGPILSTQLDIIIYDAIRHSPLIHLDACDVLPLEAVYGYVEVKAALCSSSDGAQQFADSSIEACIERNAALRAMNSRAYYVIGSGSPIRKQLIHHPWLALRSYVVAFEASGEVTGTPAAFALRMAQVLKRQGNAHLHGVLIPEHAFFYTRPVDPKVMQESDPCHVKYTVDHPLLAFKTVLIEGLATFQRPREFWTPALDLYFSHEPHWHEQSPTV
jgi:hypothetical protein